MRHTWEIHHHHPLNGGGWMTGRWTPLNRGGRRPIDSAADSPDYHTAAFSPTLHQFALHSAQWKVNEHSAHCTDHIVHWTVHSAQGCTPSALQAHSQVYFEFTPSQKHLSASVDQLLLCVAYWHNSEDFKVFKWSKHSACSGDIESWPVTAPVLLIGTNLGTEYRLQYC